MAMRADAPTHCNYLREARSQSGWRVRVWEAVGQRVLTTEASGLVMGLWDNWGQDGTWPGNLAVPARMAKDGDQTLLTPRRSK